MQLRNMRIVVMLAAFSAALALFSGRVEAQSSLNEQVSEAATLVRIGGSSNERTLASMLLCGITGGEAAKRVDDESLALIEQLLDSSDDSVRYWIALCLGHNFGPRAKGAVPKLLEILDREDCVRRANTSASAIRMALKAISGMDPPKKCELSREKQ
ncbi:MAG TPA: hypothetical protein VGJ21_15570 [Terracidiphilus sp.]|jgi:hypothetical protein